MNHRYRPTSFSHRSWAVLAIAASLVSPGESAASPDAAPSAERCVQLADAAFHGSAFFDNDEWDRLQRVLAACVSAHADVRDLSLPTPSDPRR